MTPDKFLASMIHAGTIPPPGVTILGLDSSLSAYGITIIHPDGRVMTGEIGWKPSPDRLKLIYKFIGAIILQVRPNFAAIEGYAFGKTQGMAALGEVGGVSRLVCQLTDTRLLVFPPTVIKKMVAGKGNAPKDLMMLELFKAFGLDTKTNNQCDATGAALCGLIAEGRIETTKARRAAVIAEGD